MVENVVKQLCEVHEADYEAYKTLYNALADIQKDLGKLMHDPDEFGDYQTHEAILAKIDAAKEEFLEHNQMYWSHLRD